MKDIFEPFGGGSVFTDVKQEEMTGAERALPFGRNKTDCTFLSPNLREDDLTRLCYLMAFHSQSCAVGGRIERNALPV